MSSRYQIRPREPVLPPGQPATKRKKIINGAGVDASSEKAMPIGPPFSGHVTIASSSASDDAAILSGPLTTQVLRWALAENSHVEFGPLVDPSPISHVEDALSPSLIIDNPPIAALRPLLDEQTIPTAPTIRSATGSAANTSAFPWFNHVVVEDNDSQGAQSAASSDNLQRELLTKALRHFDPNQWLNDVCISVVLSMLVSRDARVSFIDSVFSEAVIADPASVSDRKIARFERDHSNKDLVLIPYNIRNFHWVLFACYSDGRVHLHDSLLLSGFSGMAIQGFKLFWGCMAPRKPILEPVVIQVGFQSLQQNNTFDCGLYVLRQADVLTATLVHEISEPPVESTALRDYYRAMFRDLIPP
ncbi:hypothetical protein EsH8_V_001152 [Colletotrichum jinshuiense]